MEIWTEKYSPKTIDDLVCNQSKINIIYDWINNFKTTKKILLLSGPPGIGKSTLSHLILTLYKFKVIEFNTSSARGQKNIRDFFDKVLNYRSIIDMFNGGKTPTGIIMDEIDTLCNGGEKGGIGEFISILKERKNLEMNNPIICTYNDFSDKKLTELRNFAIEVKLSKPNINDMVIIFDRVCLNEKMTYTDEAKYLIIKYANGDIRRLINLLYDIFIYYGNELEIDREMAIEIFKSFSEKNIDPQIFNSTYNIFNKSLNDDELLLYYKSDILLYPMMIHENYINSIKNTSIAELEKFNLILNNIDILINNDINQTLIYEYQNWELSDNIALYFLKNINYISKLPRLSIIKDKISYTVLLNKISLFHTNKKLINTLTYKINISYINLYYLSELIINYLFNDIKKLPSIMKYYDISIDYIDIFLRINKLLNEDSKKKYTIKIKKDLMNLIKNTII